MSPCSIRDTLFWPTCRRSQLDLRQVGCLTELPKPVRPDLIEQVLLMGADSNNVNRPPRQEFLY